MSIGRSEAVVRNAVAAGAVAEGPDRQSDNQPFSLVSLPDLWGRGQGLIPEFGLGIASAGDFLLSVETGVGATIVSGAWASSTGQADAASGVPVRQKVTRVSFSADFVRRVPQQSHPPSVSAGSGVGGAGA